MEQTHVKFSVRSLKWESSMEATQLHVLLTLMKSSDPNEHKTFLQCHLNVDATSWRCIDVQATLYKRHVSAGMITHKKISFI